eukprot:2620643-Pleurochrysis_carterae.AAC.1
MAGRSGESAKLSSAMAYPLAVMRTLQRWSVPVPQTRQLRSALRGLMRSYVNVYGKNALAPRRQQPFLYKMLSDICEMPEDTL